MRGNRTVILSSVLLFVASLVVACDKGAPTTPSSASASTTAGAIITGSLTGSSVSSMSTQSVSGMTVSVMGTSITTTIDGSGHFVLTGVPSGDIRLHFKGNSADATATLTAVKSTDSITITVTVTGGTAVINSDSREDNDQGNNSGQASGTISGLSGTAPTLTFVVGGTTIHTNANTHVKAGDGEDSVSLADDGNDQGDEEGSLTLAILQNGLMVSIDGVKQSDGSILASDISVKTVTAKGAIAGLAGTCPAIHFTLGTTAVTTTSTTSFDEVSCTSLKNGTVVEVKGIQSGSTLTALKVETGDDGS